MTLGNQLASQLHEGTSRMRESQPCEGLGSLLTLGGSTPATREPVEGNSDFPISYKSPTFHREATYPS